MGTNADATADADSDAMLDAPALTNIDARDIKTFARLTPEATLDCQNTMKTDLYETPIGNLSQPCSGEPLSRPIIVIDEDQKLLQLATPCVYDDEVLLENAETYRVQQRSPMAFGDDLLLGYYRDQNQAAIHVKDDLGFYATGSGHGALSPNRDAEISLHGDLLFEGREDSSEKVHSPLPN